MPVLLRDELDGDVDAVLLEDARLLREGQRGEARPTTHGHGDLGQILSGGDGDDRDGEETGNEARDGAHGHPS